MDLVGMGIVAGGIGVITGIALTLTVDAFDRLLAPSSNGRASGFGPEGSRFEAGGVSQQFDATTVDGWLFHQNKYGWHAFRKRDCFNSGPWSTLSQAACMARERNEAEKLEAEIREGVRPSRGSIAYVSQSSNGTWAWSAPRATGEHVSINHATAADAIRAAGRAGYVSKFRTEEDRRKADMGTGVKGSEQVETAASIMRREAKFLRNKADHHAKAANDHELDSFGHKGHARRYLAEARKLEDAAHLIEPVTRVENVERKVEAGALAADQKHYGEPAAGTIGPGRDFGGPSERKVPRFEPYIGKITVTAYDNTGEPMQSAVITRCEIEDGFLAPLGTICGLAPQGPIGVIWTRLRKVAGLE